MALDSATDFTVFAQPVAAVAGSGGTTTFTVRFAPGTAGNKSVGVTIASDDPDENPFTFTVNGQASASPEPEIDLRYSGSSVSSPGSVDIGTAVASGAPLDRTFTIHNLGSADLVLSGSPKVTISGGDSVHFQLTSQPSSPIAAGADSSLTLRFAPSSAGAKSVTMSILNNDSNEGTYTVTVNATATPAPAPEINLKVGTTSYSSGQEVSVGTTALGTPKDVKFTIENLGDANLVLSSSPNYVGLSSAEDFQVTTQPASTIAGGSSADFWLRFNPTTAAAKVVILTIQSNDADEGSYKVTVSGTGQAPEINLKQGSTSIASAGGWNFGTKIEGEYVDVAFDIENTGPVPLYLTGSPAVQVSAGDFSVLSQPATTVAAGGSVQFTVRFLPTATGTRSGTLSIANDDPDEGSYTVSLSGTGEEFHGTREISGESTYTGQSASVATSGSNVYVAYYRYINSSAGSALMFGKSTNSGGTWTFSYPPLHSDLSMTYDPNPATKIVPIAADGANVFFAYKAGGDSLILEYSSDYGATWQTRNIANAQYGVLDLAVDGTYVYVIYWDASWNLDIVRLPYNCGTQTSYTIDDALQLSEPSIAVDSANVTVLCAYGSAGYRDGVYCFRIAKASLGGAWTKTTVATTANHSTNQIGYVTAVQSSGSSVYALYSYTGNFIFSKSTDGGATWSPTTLDPAQSASITYVSNAYFADLVLSGGALYYVGCTTSQELAFRKSADGGANWSAATIINAAAGIHGLGRCCSIAVNGSRVFIGSHDYALFFSKSVDGGASW